MKIVITAIVSVLMFSACASSGPTRANENSAAIAWHTMLDAEEQAILCNIYLTTPKEEVIGYFTSEPGPVSKGEAEAFYEVMNGEC